MEFNQLLCKYDVPTPRYTSYPSVPYWEGNLSSEQWRRALSLNAASPKSEVTLYLHLPFCERMCFFCGCHTFITKSHAQEGPYVKLLLSELEIYTEHVPELSQTNLKALHLGGGTPTFFSPENLKALLGGVFHKLHPSGGFNGSAEIDPRHFNLEQMIVLRDYGFRRISLGVQDFDPVVQRAVNRIQPLAMTRRATEIARRLGVTSVNFDLIYGLPYQTQTTIKQTFSEVINLRPDRIAFYSFAHVPWLKQAHRKLADAAAVGEEKRALYETGRGMLLQAGYIEIGMDHFALPEDELYRSWKRGGLHRNFMGYVEHRSDVLLGLGLSSISSCNGAYSQNYKTLLEYKSAIAERQLPLLRGHRMSEEDNDCNKHIQNIMTKGKTVLQQGQCSEGVRARLAELLEDNLIEINNREVIVTAVGRTFLRNIAVAFDKRLHSAPPESVMFSKAL